MIYLNLMQEEDNFITMLLPDSLIFTLQAMKSDRYFKLFEKQWGVKDLGIYM